MTLRTKGGVLVLLALGGCSGSGLGNLPGNSQPADPTPATGGYIYVPGPETPPGGNGSTDDTTPTTPTDPTGSTGSTDTDPVTTPPAPTPIRFLVLGDGGRGNDEQYAVAAGMEKICAAHGCDFAIYTGDVIYDEGVDGIDDSQFEDKFETPYQNLSFPFYVSVGNHDHMGDTQAQVDYSAQSTKWTMPDHYYTTVIGTEATFFALDTDPIEEGDDQHQWLDAEIAAATTTWKFAFGHHPYISNGDHGDTGGGLEAVIDQSVCGKVDVYFAGHDHDLQWLEATCGTEFIVSGAASSLRDLGGDHPTNFETSTLGFMWVEVLDRTFTGVFYDADGNELYRKSFTK